LYKQGMRFIAAAGKTDGELDAYRREILEESESTYGDWRMEMPLAVNEFEWLKTELSKPDAQKLIELMYKFGILGDVFEIWSEAAIGDRKGDG
jgi:hypothetical protein